LPKFEGPADALLWHDVLEWTEAELGLAAGTIRVSVLIETVGAAFAMDEILFALRDHITALHAGNWDYLFSMIKTFAADPEMVLPDRDSLGATTPFIRAFTELLVSTCHRRGAHAIGGMSGRRVRSRPELPGQPARSPARRRLHHRQRPAHHPHEPWRVHREWTPHGDPDRRALHRRVAGRYRRRRHRRPPRGHGDGRIVPRPDLAMASPDSPSHQRRHRRRHTPGPTLRRGTRRASCPPGRARMGRRPLRTSRRTPAGLELARRPHPLLPDRSGRQRLTL
ncbi:MAG: hypothetical protein EBY44_10250, partial [Actinobacteria bacterium]|nr:hypothetical protein [Actinomycetota bacterium]